LVERGSAGWYAAVAITDADHNLRTGQAIIMAAGDDPTGPAPTALRVTNGTKPAATANLAGLNAKAYVLGPRAFLFTGYTSLTDSLSNTATVVQNAAHGDARYPFRVYIDSPRQGTVPPEACCALVDRLDGAGLHLCVPLLFTFDAMRWLAETVRDHLEPGHKVMVEVGNENWNTQLNGDYCSAMGALQEPPMGQAAFSAWLGIQAHKIFLDVFGAANRAGDIVCAHGTQFDWIDGPIAGLVNYLNKYNFDHPDAPARLDAVLLAPYGDVPKDAPFAAAWASVMPANQNSTQFGTQWPWTLEMCHELTRYHLRYNSLFNDPVTGYHARHKKRLAGFAIPKGQAGPPKIIAYEGGVPTLVPPGVDKTGTVGRYALTVDGEYHPAMRYTLNAMFSALQAGGYDCLNYFSLCLPHGTIWTWRLVTHACRSPATGRPISSG
jgi:hypothetical protein